MNNPRSTASIAGHPIHPMLVPIPIASFVGTLLSDIAYWQGANLQWLAFSSWMLAVGILFTVLAAIAGAIDALGEPRIRSLAAFWIHAIGNVSVLLLAIFNMLVHNRDGYTAVMPTGLILSLAMVALLLVTGWVGGTMVYRHRVAVLEEGER